MNNNQIVAVIVLYKRLPEQSQTIASLGTVFARNPELLHSIRVILFDNSPKGLEQVITTLTETWELRALTITLCSLLKRAYFPGFYYSIRTRKSLLNFFLG
jgi:hypothetical protein